MGNIILTASVKTSVASARSKSLAALATSQEKADRKYAYRHVARLTGEELLEFVRIVSPGRGWGSGFRKAICRWYSSRTPAGIREEIAVCPEVGDWSHTRIIRMAHPVPCSFEHDRLFYELLQEVA